MRVRSKEIQAAARNLRRQMTPAETALWGALRGQKVLGLQFRRQHAIDRFVLDFYCPQRRLCVELDGAVHDEKHQRERDVERTRALALRGIRVVRFRNEEVVADLPQVVQKIAAALEEARGSTPAA